MQFTPLPVNPCSCGMYEKGSRCPFCETTTGGVSRKHRVQPSEQEELAAIDARLKAAELAGRRLAAAQPLAGESPECTATGIAARPASAPPSSTASATPATAKVVGGGSTAEPKARPRKKKVKAERRTTAQVKRAAERQELERRGEAFWTELGTAVEGNEQELDAFMESIRND